MTKLNIALIGFMGTGKSCVAQKLGKELDREVVSTDALIVEQQGKSIHDIFKELGEKHFRLLEREVVGSLADRKELIIDCGGGIVVDQANLDLLKKTSVLVCLTAEPESIYERVKDKRSRPLLNVDKPLDKIKQLLDQRAPLYSQADHMVPTDGLTVDDNVRDVLAALEKEQE